MRIKVTGYLEIEDDEFDSESDTGLTEEAFLSYNDELTILDDISFEA